MGVLSTLDVQTRLDVHELVNRYCQLIDHGDGTAFTELFTADAVFEFQDDVKLVGRAEIAGVPGLIQKMGGGNWRHQVTNLVIDRMDQPRQLRVSAYVMVIDWSNGGSMACFAEYRMELRKTCHWQISNLLGTTHSQCKALAEGQGEMAGTISGMAAAFRPQYSFH
ncbi:hypothetical protein BH10PSE12_BH10PSE12_09470 [soil metagenome]